MGVVGYKHSKEAIEKIRESNRRRVLSKEAITNMRNAQIGKKLSDETKKKIAKTSSKPIRFIKNDNGCYICTSHPFSKGYPVIRRDYKVYRMSRYLWELKNGKIPDGMLICHTCDTPACINIKHLFIGTSNDNVQDMVNKKRHTYGSRNNGAKLTEDQIKEIRSYKHTPDICIHLSNIYGVTHGTIRKIRSNKSWKHLL